MLLKTTWSSTTALRISCSCPSFVKKHLTTSLLCALGLLLFFCGDLVTPSSLSSLDRNEFTVAAPGTSNNQEQDDTSCDVADEDDGDDDSQADQQDLFAALPKSSLTLSYTAKFLPVALSESAGSSFDASSIPNRAPPLVDQSA